MTLSALVLLLALLPRVGDLNCFLIADENNQLAFSYEFLTGAHKINPAYALISGYPGVTSNALGALGLLLQDTLHHLGFSGLRPLPQSGNTIAAVAELQADPLAYIVAIRLPLAVVGALSVLGVYLLVKRLFGQRVALLSAILLALDPFFLAHTRINHVDGPVAYWMILAFLPFLIFLRELRFRWLIISGVAGSLALLTKSPALSLVPMILLSLVIHWALAWRQAPRPFEQRTALRVGLALLIWAAILIGIFLVPWFLIGQDPVPVMRRILQDATRAMSIPHDKGTFFMGYPRSDPGPWFYPTDIVLRMTPLTLVGVLACLVGLASSFGKQHPAFSHGEATHPACTCPAPPEEGGADTGEKTGVLRTPAQWAAVLALLIYVPFFTIMLNQVAKKGDRYVIPVFPPLDILAAVGGVWLIERLADSGRAVSWTALKRLRLDGQIPLWGVILLLILALQAALVLPYYPYFLAYYNPLVGGPWLAPRVISVGLGEGLDQAARYLSEKKHSEGMRVTSWYSWQFAPYFAGKTVDLSNVQTAVAADYTVFYINQVQRGFPNPELVDFFIKERQPEHTIRLGGIEYAWIYPGQYSFIPPESISIQHPLDVNFGDKLRLLGYDIATYPSSALGSLHAGGTGEQQIPADKQAHVTLYWQVSNRMAEDYNVTLRLTDDAGNIWGQLDRYPLGGFLRTGRWQRGAIVRDDYRLGTLTGTPPGRYRLEIGVYSPTTGHTLPPTGGTVIEATRLAAGQVTVAKPDSWPPAETLPIQHRLYSNILAPGSAQPSIGTDGGIRLLGFDLGAGPFRPGEPLNLTLYWQAMAHPDRDYSLAFRLAPADGSGKPSQEWQQPFLNGRYPTSQWSPGEIVRDPQRLLLPARLLSGKYELSLALWDAQQGQPVGDFVSLATINVVGRPHAFQEPAISHPLPATLGDKIELLGYALDTTEVQAGATLNLTLYWKALAEMDTSYTVFIHILDEGGTIYGQRDRLPGDGAYPTTSWLGGEVLTDTHPLQVSLAAHGGNYRLAIGLYDSASGARLPASSDVAEVSQDRIMLDSAIKVSPLP
jgi:4-amino-4-deoxy-L-arabinose transferase-like glycosyltransferase